MRRPALLRGVGLARRFASGAAERRVVVSRGSDGVAMVALSRGDKMNACDLRMFEELSAAGRSLIEDRSVRAVVLHGEGRAFCAGLDVKSVVLEGPSGQSKLLDRDPPGALTNLVQDVGMVWRQIQAPVIAAVHGPCFGAGLQIALGADFRIASPCAQLSIMEVKWGLIPDLGATVTLRDLVPIDVAKELTMTGRVVDAAEAKTLNLVTRVCDEPLQESVRFAQELAGKSPDALAAAKALYNRAWPANEEEALVCETEVQRKLIPVLYSTLLGEMKFHCFSE